MTFSTPGIVVSVLLTFSFSRSVIAEPPPPGSPVLPPHAGHIGLAAALVGVVGVGAQGHDQVVEVARDCSWKVRAGEAECVGQAAAGAVQVREPAERRHRLPL
ncbi:hypothetical protein ACFY05_01415 [Microtetraspora fusca]|uniref:Secreted protein n=1 Tax=Microtetraspora fusca TaxID=1997 RepID=A0ABW6UWS1_MICFU